MHESFRYTCGFCCVCVGGKTCESFLKHINSQGIVAANQHIDSQVVLETINGMWVRNVFWDKIILSIFYFGVPANHLYPSSTRCIRWFHDPQTSFFSIFAEHLETVEIIGKQIGHRNKIIGLRMRSSLFIQIFPHAILASQLPAARKMIHLLISVHVFKSFLVHTCDIEKNVPIWSSFALLETVELKRVYNASVFRSRDFVFEVCFLKAVHSFDILAFYSTAFGVMEEYSGWPVFKFTSYQMRFGSPFLRGFSLTLHINAIV